MLLSPGAKGILALLFTFSVWGLSSLYYHLLAHVPPLVVLCYRTLGSLAFFAGLLAVQGRLGEVVAALRTPRKLVLIVGAALMISLNWFGFIYSISIGNALEASLGYYIFPLVAVGLGAVVFRERLTRVQVAAVALAGFAVVLLTLGLGVAPWIALGLATSFAAYGALKKGLDLGGVVSVTAEVTVLAPFAVLWLIHTDTVPGIGTLGWHDLGLLAFSGLLTGLPLVLFGYAARRVRFSTLGLVQYLNPTLQFAVAVLFFGNALTVWHLTAFPLIWTALALYSASALHADRAARLARVPL
ncbi:chloramphenicol-sensitive protein RarD [Loktanella fryxellensis]|uniref:Chloramphenicol-sensitive protein RarD n=1 Tax=Loktanella fryxellensis TaxID=245187 RepID=A0A1H8BHK5_9RHOB|nr:EamA family transporter RarD [Loktanella fryxellensis]SEM81939.1 chloramphenicol-sensitive protein RarD [Loktanella fryxellensis]